MATRVHSVLFNVLAALGFADVASVHSEVDTFSIRPDLWVIEVRGIPIGVVQVKKRTKTSMLLECNIQIYSGSFMIVWSISLISTASLLCLEC